MESIDKLAWLELCSGLKLKKKCSSGCMITLDGWMTKCPSFKNAQRLIAQGNILPNDFMPNMTICPRRHFAQRLYAQGDNVPK